MNKSNILDRNSFNNKYNFSLATPMIQQYLEVKFSHQDCLLAFRMGDFYELFFDDAINASKILSIALAKRGKNNGDEIPMCGVPHHAFESYLHKLISQGYKVAICDQLETPEDAKKRGGYKAVVNRDVIRIITPGTVIEENILDPHKPSYLCSINLAQNNNFVICYVDISTGEFNLLVTKIDNLANELLKLQPKEILLSNKYQDNLELQKILKPFFLILVYQVDNFYDLTRCKRQIEDYYKINSHNSIGQFTDYQIKAIGSLLQYVQLTQKQNTPKLPYPKLISSNFIMNLDHATRKSLEIVSSLSGDKNGSLLFELDQTITRGGARLIYKYLNEPLNSSILINRRLDITEFFIENFSLSLKIRDTLKQVSDSNRILSKISMRKTIPYDLILLKHTLEAAIIISEEFYLTFSIKPLPNNVEEILAKLNFNNDILKLITDAIENEPSNNISNGGVIKKGYHPKIDELRSLINNNKKYLDELKTKYQKITGIDNLKINHNNLIGFFVEIGSKQAERIDDKIFSYKQSTSNSHRFVTNELKELETKLLNANSSLIALESVILDSICDQIIENIEPLRELTDSLSILDVFTNFAFISKANNYTKPIIDDSNEFIIEKGRHPVVEHSLSKNQNYFSPNSCKFDMHHRLWLITGPNMGGKSTFLRQNAIICIMAQIGCYVPAEKCKIGVVDQIFSRIGTGDDLSNGQSTFMVEMIETSAILAQATAKSLIIFDEVGRGTATFDGMAIAWSILEHVHDSIKCRCFFATHYHELTKLANNLLSLINYTVSIEEIDSQIIFTHRIIPGSADKSYGIHVAELAGLPTSLVRRSQKILLQLQKKENTQIDNVIKNENDNYNLFSASISEEVDTPQINKLKKYIIDLNPDELTPMKAMEKLYEIKRLASDIT